MNAITQRMALSRKTPDELVQIAGKAAKSGNSTLADQAELAYIKATKSTVVRCDGSTCQAVPTRIIRGFGSAGRLAVEWQIAYDTVYTDIDGKEL